MRKDLFHQQGSSANTKRRFDIEGNGVLWFSIEKSPRNKAEIFVKTLVSFLTELKGVEP